MKRDVSRQKLLFPKVPDLEYLDLIRNRKTILSLNSEDLKPVYDKNWRELSFFLQDKLTELYGQKYQPDKYNYVMKVKGSDLINRGSIKTLYRENSIMKQVTNDHVIENQLAEIKNYLSKHITENISTEMIIQLTRQSYEQQIKYLELQLNDKISSISKLENKIIELEDDIENYIRELQSKSGIGSYIEMAQKLLSLKVPANSINLSESNVSDIPESIIQILGMVDYSKISESDMNKIIDGLQKYIQLLPLKGK